MHPAGFFPAGCANLWRRGRGTSAVGAALAVLRGSFGCQLRSVAQVLQTVHHFTKWAELAANIPVEHLDIPVAQLDFQQMLELEMSGIHAMDLGLSSP